ncbi:hypothetical protein Sjap_015925 [Stephania japonica]|uniref:Uncharacterized protein n=1 Tax=Stephania japonica TaxID=461633 RepID=A0AAP0NRU9_9MAGN
MGGDHLSPDVKSSGNVETHIGGLRPSSSSEVPQDGWTVCVCVCGCNSGYEREREREKKLRERETVEGERNREVERFTCSVTEVIPARVCRPIPSRGGDDCQERRRGVEERRENVRPRGRERCLTPPTVVLWPPLALAGQQVSGEVNGGEEERGGVVGREAEK